MPHPIRPRPRAVLTLLATASSLAVLTLTSPPAAAGSAPDISVDQGGSVFEGRFETRIADMFDGTQQITHHLVSDSEEIEINVDPQSYPDLKYEAKVRAYGTRLTHAEFAVDWLEVTEPAPEPLIGPEPRSPRRIAVLLVQPGGQADQMTVDELQARVFENDDSTERFFIENSYGMESFEGGAFGPYSIAAVSGCDYQAIGEAARSAFAADGHNLDDYDQFMYYMTRISSCGWSGLASVGSPDNTARDTWYNGSAGCVVLAQELAHNYGLMHTHTYINCSSDIFPGPSGCQENEYGSPYDPMGRGCGHTANYQKSYMGWHEECNIVTTQQNGTYNLLPTELPCNGTQTLRLPLGDGNYYYIEYRQPIGPFGRWSGVLVYYGPEYTGNRSGPDGFLVNVTGADDWYMHAGESYTDYSNRVTFSVTEENATHAVIQVSYPSSSGSPSCAGGGAPVDGGNGNVGTLECADGPPGGDEVPPTVSITAPPDGTEYMGPANFQVTAEAMDDVQIVQVDLRMNGTSVAVDRTEPYEWDITNLVDGTYEFTAIATDGTNRVTSDPVTVTVVGGGDSDSGGESDGGESDAGEDSSDAGEDGEESDAGDEADGSSDAGEDDGDTGEDDGQDSGVGEDDGSGDDGSNPTTTTTTSTTTATTTTSTTGFPTTTGNPFEPMGEEGCACRSDSSAAPRAGWLALLLLPIFGRRRRSSIR